MVPTVVDRIRSFVAGRGHETFERLVADAFAFQRRRIDAIDRLARAAGIGRTDGPVTWRDIPPVPAGTFAEVTLAAAPAEETFRSSGTTGGPRSVHHHAFPDLYRTVIDASFPDFCFDDALRAGGARPRMLALIPPRDQIADSSLGFMVDHVIRRFGAPESRYGFGESGTDNVLATRFAETAIADRHPILILSTAFALVQWLDDLAARDHRLALPTGSVIFETGGTKGRVRDLDRDELLSMIAQRLDVAPNRVVREYGMTELTSQLYGQALLGGDPDRLVGPPWVRVHVLDPLRLAPLPPGEEGLIAIFDLANVGSALHIVTEDLGVMHGDGVALHGRARGADLRGCSLTVEELARGRATAERP